MDLDVDAIRAQVDRLVQSKTFETSEVHRRLLQYLAKTDVTRYRAIIEKLGIRR